MIQTRRITLTLVGLGEGVGVALEDRRKRVPTAHGRKENTHPVLDKNVKLPESNV
jgi:hypothetical protein